MTRKTFLIRKQNKNSAKHAFWVTIGLLLLAWMYSTYWLFSEVIFIDRFHIFAHVLPMVLLVMSLKSGPGKLSATFGKILIAIGVLSLVTFLIDKGFSGERFDITFRAGLVLTGIFLERISPKERLYPFMFLAIATKIEFVIVGVLYAAIASPQGSGYIPAYFWWGVVVLMALAIPLLAFSQKTAYRIFVLLTSILALVLFIDALLAYGHWNYIVSLAAAAVLWPVVTERLIGIKTFRGRNSTG